VKTSNGFFHSLAFTTGFFPDAIQIKARNHRVTEASCRRCHEAMVMAIDSPHRGADATSCVRCHAGVGHGDSVMSAAPKAPRIEAKRIQP
jgi:cytochrome c nitrite reductase small subunit